MMMMMMIKRRKKLKLLLKTLGILLARNLHSRNQKKYSTPVLRRSLRLQAK
jgi:hypothetical protein